MSKAATTTTIVLLFIAFFAASASATIPHPTPKNELKKRKPTGPLPPPAQFVPTFNLEQQQYLKAHNDLRRRVGVPPLVWDATLTANAHDWAERRRGDCNYRTHSSNQHGENIFWMSYKEFLPNDVVQKWFDEYKLYDWGKKSCKCHPERDGCECGHYLNVVWSSTKRVGCSGAVFCDQQKGVYVVCQYDPPASLSTHTSE